MIPEFKKWEKIYRKGKGTFVITEKIDGTNAQIVITEDGSIYPASRSRYITLEDDNYGFAKWVEENKEDLLSLGEGHHYGEWAGEGIQKNPHNLKGKHLFLFNTNRWGEHNPNTPKCCEVVPIILTGDGFSTMDKAMEILLENGSFIGDCGEPEGVVGYSTFLKIYQKCTFKSPNGKWISE